MSSLNETAVLDNISEAELLRSYPSLRVMDSRKKNHADEVSVYFLRGGPSPIGAQSDFASQFGIMGNDNRPQKQYWDYVKKEFFIMFCGDSEKYAALWKEVEQLKDKSSDAIVMTVSAYIGATLGLEAGVLGGLCALCLYTVLKIGKDAFCAYAGAIEGE
jgi:hypothetical protein